MEKQLDKQRPSLHDYLIASATVSDLMGKDLWTDEDFELYDMMTNVMARFESWFFHGKV